MDSNVLKVLRKCVTNIKTVGQEVYRMNFHTHEHTHTHTHTHTRSESPDDAPIKKLHMEPMECEIGNRAEDTINASAR